MTILILGFLSKTIVHNANGTKVCAIFPILGVDYKTSAL